MQYFIKVRRKDEIFVSNLIGQKLKTLRKGRKMSQERLGEELGLTRATISNWETGRRAPHLSELKRVCEYFGVSLDYMGVMPTDEVFDLISRAREVFKSEEVPKEKKEELYREIMRLYLSLQ